MHLEPLNPFIKAFFASRLPSQCVPAADHILLVPDTSLLLTHNDRDTGIDFAEFVNNEEFLASHVLRIATSRVAGPGGMGKDGPSLRDSKTKAKQYPTANGKTVVIKDTFVYSNKGFKTLTSAQLLKDELLYADDAPVTQWLIYYISRPLLGFPVPKHESLPTDSTLGNNVAPSEGASPTKVEVEAFVIFRNQNPVVERHAGRLQGQLAQLVREFQTDLERSQLTKLPSTSRSSSFTRESSYASSNGSSASINSLKRMRTPRGTSPLLSQEEIHLSQAFERLVVSAIDTVRLTDKQQLWPLESSLKSSEPRLERLIEKHMAEQVHTATSFPQICSMNHVADEELGKVIKDIQEVDITQVGISINEGQAERSKLHGRMARGTECFKKMDEANSPHEMIDILIETQRQISSDKSPQESAYTSTNEKPTPTSTIDADTLVSIFIIVVVRSSVHHLHARLSYMRSFPLYVDVESGGIGYAISTFEAVLTYIKVSSAALRKISRANRALWLAVKRGNLNAIENILDPANASSPDEFGEMVEGDAYDRDAFALATTSPGFWNGSARVSSSQDSEWTSESSSANLSHVFPWQSHSDRSKEHRPALTKRVSMDLRSLSSSSVQTLSSLASTAPSARDMIIGETSTAQLCQTQDSSGRSLLRMAVDYSQDDVLDYFLQMEEHYPPKMVLEDMDYERTSLLSAAIQLNNRSTLDTLLDYVMQNADTNKNITVCLAQQDRNGRTFAHYLFNAPDLIEPLATLLPWRTKDKSGQTPLFALLRSYDHEDYRGMIQKGLSAALKHQGDGDKLHVDDHTDHKGNTLLHIANDSRIIQTLLRHCDADPNAANEKLITPAMIASKFARIDSVKAFVHDARTDLFAREHRGLTAVEMAKDDEVRNRIDDIILLSTTSVTSTRSTAILRSYFVEDGSLRVVVKSGAPNDNSTVTVTTCRRSLADFQNLAQWLLLEHPSSWLPSLTELRSPFQIWPKPSRQTLHHTQIMLEGFLRTVLLHPTLGTHEMLWEFILVPDIDYGMLADRARRKAELRVDKLREEYEPIIDGLDSVALFADHAHGQVYDLDMAARNALRSVSSCRRISNDLVTANRLSSSHLESLAFLPTAHRSAFACWTSSLANREMSPTTYLHYSFLTLITTTQALLYVLSRPSALIDSIAAQREAVGRQRSSASRSQRWPSALGLLDDTRARMFREGQQRVDRAERRLLDLGCELNYTQQTVATELAGWQAMHAKSFKQDLTDFVRKTVIVERARLAKMRGSLRAIQRASDGND